MRVRSLSVVGTAFSYIPNYELMKHYFLFIWTGWQARRAILLRGDVSKWLRASRTRTVGLVLVIIACLLTTLVLVGSGLTSAIAGTARPTPTAVPTPTIVRTPTLIPVKRIEEALASSPLGYRVERVQYDTQDTQTLSIEFGIAGALTSDGVRSNAQTQVHAVLSALSRVDVPYTTVNLKGRYPMVSPGATGEAATQNIVVVNLFYSRKTVTSTDWQTYHTREVYSLADRGYVHPQFNGAP